MRAGSRGLDDRGRRQCPIAAGCDRLARASALRQRLSVVTCGGRRRRRAPRSPCADRARRARLPSPSRDPDSGAARAGGMSELASTVPGQVEVEPGEDPAAIDSASREWLSSLRAEGPARDDAIERLHALLLRGARFEVGRRQASLPHLRGGELDDIALEAADDALMSVLRRLDDFRGLSRFTTWAYKFALYEAAVKLRRRAWQAREVPMEQDGWDLLSSVRLEPDQEVEQSELLTAIQRAIELVLTPHQRRVLIALAVNGVPIDVLADRLGTTRGALYKPLHDARRKLRRQLSTDGYSLGSLEATP